MDNASYRSRRVERLPTSQWKEIEIAKRLISKKVIFKIQNNKKYVIEQKRLIDVSLKWYYCERE